LLDWILRLGEQIPIVFLFYAEAARGSSFSKSSLFVEHPKMWQLTHVLLISVDEHIVVFFEK